MKISHEVPKCLLTTSPEFNDYDYCLPHLLDQDEVYKQYFLDAKEKGRYIIMDNSLHELGEAYDHKRLHYWVNKLEPNEFIVPDVWMDRDRTLVQAKYWLQFTYPKNTLPIAVIQGKNKEEASICAYLLVQLGYKKLCVSYGASWYGESDLDKSLGRINFVKELLSNENFPHIKFHLLGCAVPQEFGWYNNHPQIESIDTSNPIMAALDGNMYSKQGLTQKPKSNMNDNYNIEFFELNYDLVLKNTKRFREINGLTLKDNYKKWQN